MKHLFERLHSPIGQDTSRLHKKASHLSLPTFIDLAASHTRACPFKVFGFEVPDQQSVRTQKQRVVVPSRLAQSREHLRPHAAVAGFVFLQPFRLLNLFRKSLSLGHHHQQQCHLHKFSTVKIPEKLTVM